MILFCLAHINILRLKTIDKWKSNLQFVFIIIEYIQFDFVHFTGVCKNMNVLMKGTVHS